MGILGGRAAGARLERVRASKRFVDGAFKNTSGVAPGMKGNPLPLLGEFFFANTVRIPKGTLPTQDPRQAWTQQGETGLRLTWLGHSTVLLEMDGVTILTDPVFGERASPTSFAGPKRFHPVPVALGALPKLDLVLLSHDHYDHLCVQSIRELARMQVPFVTSLGVGAHLEKYGVAASNITELEWWEEASLAGGRLQVTATPAQHFSGRSVGDRNHTLWSSWVLQSNKHRVFFSGDTGLTPEFAEIGARKGPFDLTLLEVGAWHPSWGDIHLGPENALKAFHMLGGGTLLPVHWGTFNLALHAWDEPAETLMRLAQAQGARVITPRLGHAVEPARLDGMDAWWREVVSSR